MISKKISAFLIICMSFGLTTCRNEGKKDGPILEENRKSERIIEDNTASDGVGRKNNRDTVRTAEQRTRDSLLNANSEPK
jgi:hypothetical protein